MPSILFVCTANQCRSPMAMALMRKRLKDKGMTPEWVVESAGTWATDGITATDNAVETMSELDLDLESHFSRRLTEEMLESFDLVLVMVENHKEAIAVEFPHHSEKVLLLSEMIGEEWDLEDPVGRPIEEYRETAKVIDDVLDAGWDRMIELARSPSEENTS
jgi:protein-tyrosine-phosphatase